jgi:hypothetical protein
MIGPDPMSRIFLMSVRFGIVVGKEERSAQTPNSLWTPPQRPRA